MKLGQAFVMAAAMAAGAALSPAATVSVIDLTTAGASDNANGAYFVQVNAQSTGTGVIRPFLQISGNSDILQGYNTDGRPVEFDEDTNRQYTHSLSLADVPAVAFDGQACRQFLLDINQTKSSPLLSLSALEI